METESGLNSNPNQLRRIYLWTNCRSLGTVFLKCLSNIKGSQIINGMYISCFFYGVDPMSRAGTQVSERFKNITPEDAQINLDEFPFLYHMKDESSTCSWAKTQLECDYPGKQYLICKDLAFGLCGQHDLIPKGFRHTFLIRHPYRVFHSWKKATSMTYGMPDPNFKDHVDKYCKQQFNFKEQYNLYQHLKSNHQLGDPDPVILDADDLLSNPEAVLSQYCQAVGIPFTPDLLQWKPGMESIKQWKISQDLLLDGLFGKEGGFYKNALESTSFRPLKPLPDRSELQEDVLQCADIGLPYYEKMYALRNIFP